MFDVEKFINVVKQRPVVYDLQSKDYSNRQIKANCWSEIGETMYEDWNTMATQDKKEKGKILVKKWKALRDNFVRDYKLFRKTETGVAASIKKKYIFFDQLEFLIPHLKRNKNALFPEKTPQKHKQAQCCDDYRQHSVQTKGPDGESHQSVQSGNRQDRDNRRQAIEETVVTADINLPDILSENMSSQKLERDNDNFGNKAFMLSFVPAMDNLSHSVCLEIRLRITQTFNELAKSTYNFCSPSSLQSCHSSPSISDLSESVSEPTAAIYNFPAPSNYYTSNPNPVQSCHSSPSISDLSVSVSEPTAAINNIPAPSNYYTSNPSPLQSCHSSPSISDPSVSVSEPTATIYNIPSPSNCYTSNPSSLQSCHSSPSISDSTVSDCELTAVRNERENFSNMDESDEGWINLSMGFEQYGIIDEFFEGFESCIDQT